MHDKAFELGTRLDFRKDFMYMRREKFKMERPNLVQPGDHVEITEIQTNMNYSYIIEPAVAMSGCFKAPERLKSREGVIVSVDNTPRGFIVTAEFDE